MFSYLLSIWVTTILSILLKESFQEIASRANMIFFFTYLQIVVFSFIYNVCDIFYIWDINETWNHYALVVIFIIWWF